MIKLHAFITFLIVWSFSFTQKPINYSIKNGLPSNHIYRITQDKLGFIWMISDKGIIKYNGNQFKVFTTNDGLPINDIWDIRITKDNKVWFFSKSVELGYIENDSIYTFPCENKNQIFFPRNISQADNQVFFLNFESNYFLKNDKWRGLRIQNKEDSLIWLSIIHPILNKTTTDSGKIIIRNKKNQPIKATNPPLKLGIIKIQGQINDSLYYWVYDNSYAILNLNTLHYVHNEFKEETDLIRLSYANNIIQFSGKDFIFILNDSLEITRSISIPKKHNSHFSFIDKQGNLWVATSTQGVFFYQKPIEGVKNLLSEEKCDQLNLLNNHLVANVQNKGFYIFDTLLNDFKPYIEANEFILSSYYSKELKTEYYITNRRIITQKKGLKKEYSIPYGHEIAKKIIYHNGFLYGNTSQGVNVLNHEDLSVSKQYYQNGIKDLIVFNDIIYLATTNGIMEIRNDKIRPVSNLNEVLMKPITKILAIEKDKALVCTDGFGAYTTNFLSARHIPETEHLSIQGAYIKNNFIWLATNEGLKLFYKQQNNYTLIRELNDLDGLSLQVLNDVSAFKNIIFTSSNNGITCFYPRYKRPEKSLLHIYFNKVTYNQELLKNKSVYYSANNNLTIFISTVNFNPQKKLIFEYKLLPIQKKWSKTTSQNISFNNLQPDKYELIIISEGKRNHFQFIIKPLWWQRTWVKLLLILLGLILILYIVLLFYRKKEKRIQHKLEYENRLIHTQLKALRSQMNPHFVFNSLASIQYYINNNDLETSDLYLVKFSKLIRKFFEISKEEEILLSEEIDLLTNYIEIEQLRFKNRFTFSIEISHNLNCNQTMIPTMLLQPIIENSINHGIFNKTECGRLTILFKKNSQNELIACIIDDGVGMQKNKLKNSINSTNILKDRLYFLNHSGRWSISYHYSEPFPERKDKGVKVKFIIQKNE